jgi:hypothetical protein
VAAYTDTCDTLAGVAIDLEGNNFMFLETNHLFALGAIGIIGTMSLLSVGFLSVGFLVGFRMFAGSHYYLDNEIREINKLLLLL